VGFVVLPQNKIQNEPENKLDRKISYEGDRFLYKKLDEIDDKNEENLQILKSAK